MATVKSGNSTGSGQSKQSGSHDKSQINKIMPEAHARDDISGAFAGKENDAKFSREKHSTSLKSRRSQK